MRLIKDIIICFAKLYWSIFLLLFVMPVHYAIWRRKNNGKSFARYLNGE